MKNILKLIAIDSNFSQWLMTKLLQSPPESDCSQDLLSALEEMNKGDVSGIVLTHLNTSPTPFITMDKAEKMCFGQLSIIPNRRQVFFNSTEIFLTPKEFDILFFLAKNRGEVFTKEQIYKAVWNNDCLLDDNTIMAFIRKLRKKIEPNPDAPNYILTIWGIGYKFNETLEFKNT